MLNDLFDYRNTETITEDPSTSDAPYFALKELGEIGERVIDHYYNMWNELGFLFCDDEEANRELAMALTNIAYFVENDMRWNSIAKNLNIPQENNVLIFGIVGRVFKEVDNFNTERFISILSQIDGDFSKFSEAYDDVLNYVDIEAEFSTFISDLIIEEFHRTEEFFKNKSKE